MSKATSSLKTPESETQPDLASQLADLEAQKAQLEKERAELQAEKESLIQAQADAESLKLDREVFEAEKEAFETDLSNQEKKFEYAFKDLEKRMAKMEKANQDAEKPKEGVEYKPGPVVGSLFKMALDAKIEAKSFKDNRKKILEIIKPVMDAHQDFFSHTDADHPDFALVTEHFRELRKQFNL